MARGNKGFFFGAPLLLLQKHLPRYLASEKKEDFWQTFWPEWDGAYLELDTDELRQELKEAVARVREKNKTAAKGKARRNAKLTKHPTPGERMNELRARGSDHAVSNFALGSLLHS
jgi:hypothetical protein